MAADREEDPITDPADASGRRYHLRCVDQRAPRPV